MHPHLYVHPILLLTHPSTILNIHPSTYLFINPSTHQSAHSSSKLFIHLFVLSTHLSLHSSHPFINPSTYSLPRHLFIHLSSHSFIHSITLHQKLHETRSYRSLYNKKNQTNTALPSRKFECLQKLRTTKGMKSKPRKQGQEKDKARSQVSTPYVDQDIPTVLRIAPNLALS